MDALLEENVSIMVDDVSLKGNLYIPENAKGIVIFSHGAGSSRLSPRNRMVAEYLNENGFATLLFDLLTQKEDQHYEMRFNIELLTERLQGAIRWVRENDQTAALKVALFGASTGAASALKATARLEDGAIKTVISRGGRPDLAIGELGKVNCPVILMIGSLDTAVIDMNYTAAENLKDHHVEVISGASHLFEEPGKLEEVADKVVAWLNKKV